MNNKKSVSYTKYGYIFSIPFVLAFLVFQLYPVLYTVVIGFTDLQGVATTEFHFLKNPLENFIKILSTNGAGSFRLSLRNTVLLWVLNFIPQISLSLLLTAWFTDTRTTIKGQGLFKVLFYMPNIITAASVAILFGALLSYPQGPLNSLIGSFKGDDYKAINFLANKNFTRFIVAFIQFWMWYGNTMVMLIAGVIGISPEIFEAAEIDGANRTQTFFKVTIPCIRTILLYVLVTSMIGGLNMFDIPKLIADGGPDGATGTTALYIYKQAFSGGYMYNKAAAASIIMFVIIMILSMLLFYILRDKDEEALKKAIKREKKAANARR